MSERHAGAALEPLTSLGLKDHAQKRPNALSGGQRQRVVIAARSQPPGSSSRTSRPALDNINLTSVRHPAEIADSGRTVVVVTHDPALAARADRRLHIVDGKIAQTFEGQAKAPEAAVVAATGH